MSSDNIRDQSCIVRHSSHLYHCLCTIFECTKHLRTHFTTSSLFKNCIRVTIVVDLVILSFTHNFYVQAHCFSEAIQMHNCTRLISIRSCVDNAFFFCKFLQVWSKDSSWNRRYQRAERDLQTERRWWYPEQTRRSRIR